MKRYDIVIAGGAMAGATLALALNAYCQETLSIAVVEPFLAQHDEHPGYDSRSIALSYGTVELLKNMQLWSAIKPYAVAINHIHVSDRGHAGMTDMDANEMGIEALGYVVELADTGRIYHEKLQQAANIDFLCPASVTSIERDAMSVSLLLSSGETIQAPLLVAADGTQSVCCDEIGLKQTEQDFGQVAVIANITAEQAHEGRAFERFTESGPLALLPMSEGRLSLVWCLSSDEANKVLSLSDSQFLVELQSAFGWRLGKFTLAGSRTSYPLLLRTRDQFISHRVAVIGNAAQTLHPIAGQGFNLGIRDVATLAQEIAKAGQDIGEYRLLSRYAQRRNSDREQTISLTAGLVHLFSNDYPAMRIGRNLGLMLMDNVSLVRTPLLRRTMGLVER
ncbi:2-octaprenyl-6-methoxyphenyl hydroxylase [Vibrio tapetis subsp. quintayensis]|uniref:2-octaprenyl-6-methoxyphenyl hydroxylase n=1 Tax=Vibrio tapetis TaxID=52443 RepID=UPI0025B589BF|nr:2-octaprenyl-6-methoxyphenyl hydroxylase [Vibrio tapetis]MDN3681702.1 2-octaprenyl-6-methoxyphenyl hydroxylase [Vibrio tapetis subsp. quintayensis]